MGTFGLDVSSLRAEQPVRAFIITGTRLYREGLAKMLEADPRLRVVGTAATLDGDLGLAARADIVLLDLGAASHPSAIPGFVASVAPARVVAFGLHHYDEAAVLRYAEAGMVGYVPCTAGVDELVDTLDAAMRDELVCSPHTAAALMRHIGALARERAPVQALGRLTAREAQILSLVDAGLSNKEIASRLQIRTATVKNNLHNAFEKLGVHGRGEAAARVRAPQV